MRDTRPHGQRWVYVHGCRCRRCRRANTVYTREQITGRLARVAAGDPRVPHGAGGYANWGCRCKVCYAAHSQSEALRRARRKLAAGKPLSDYEAKMWEARNA